MCLLLVVEPETKNELALSTPYAGWPAFEKMKPFKCWVSDSIEDLLSDLAATCFGMYPTIVAKCRATHTQ